MVQIMINSDKKYEWNMPGIVKRGNREKVTLADLENDSDITDESMVKKQDNGACYIVKPIMFEVANVPVEVAAKALGTDKQTLRVMIQQKIVDWGIAYKLPNSTQYTYLISPKKFYEATGFAYRPKE